MAPEFHDWFTKHHHHHHHYHHHLLRVRPWYTCFTKHVTLAQLTHSNPSFLNSISILSSNLHLHLFILRILNPSFVWISHFLYICTCPTYHTWYNYLRASVRQRLTSVEITFQFHNTGTLTPSHKIKIISLNLHCCSLFLKDINKSVPVSPTSRQMKIMFTVENNVD